MAVTVPVIAVGGPLGHHLGLRQGQDRLAPVHGMGRKEGLHRVEGFPHIPPAAAGNVLGHPLLPADPPLPVLAHFPDSPKHHRQNLLRRHRLKGKDRGPAEHRVVNVEIGILRGGGNEGQFSRFHKLQQGLLLLLIEILNLIQIQHHPLRCQQSPHIRGDGLDVR